MIMIMMYKVDLMLSSEVQVSVDGQQQWNGDAMVHGYGGPSVVMVRHLLKTSGAGQTGQTRSLVCLAYSDRRWWIWCIKNNGGKSIFSHLNGLYRFLLYNFNNLN